MKPDRKGLQSWYREAMLRRIDEVVELREAVASGSSSACDELRSIAQALRGSGGTFGFPEISVGAGLVETTSDDEVPRRLEGLLVELRKLVGEKRDEGRRIFEWLAVSAGLESLDRLADPPATLAEAWAVVGDAAGMTDSELARSVAERFRLKSAQLGSLSGSARRLVPEAFMASESVVPVAEDSATITVASADPVSLSTELELGRLTGRRPVFAVASPRALQAVLDGPSRGDAWRSAPPL